MGNTVTIAFAGDDKSLGKTLGQLETQTGKTSSSLSKFGTVAKVGAVAAFGGLAVVAKMGFDEFTQGEAATASLTAALKSADHATGLTTSSISDLSTELMKKSGIDDDAITHAASLALGFKNIRSNADIFTKAMKDAVDISTKYGISVDSAAKIAAKALNDPIKGMTQLQKYGVTLDQQEKDNIKTLVAHGQVTQAQAILQDKLTQSVGGSATAYGKTLSGQIDIAKQTFANLTGQLVGALMPAFQALVGTISSVVGWLQQHDGVAKVLIVTVGGLAAAVLAVNTAVKTWNVIQDAAMTISKLFVTQVAVQATATEGATIAQEGMNTALRANPIGIVVTALAALATGLVLAWQHSKTFRDIVGGALNTVKTVIGGVVTVIEGIVGGFKSAITWAQSFFGLFTANTANATKQWDALTTFIGSTKPGTITIVPGHTAAVGTPLGPPAPHAMGGVFTTPHVGLVAESGPEAVVPLSRPSRAMAVMSQAGLGGGGAPPLTIVNNIYALDPQAASTAVIRSIDEWERRNGQRYARA